MTETQTRRVGVRGYYIRECERLLRVVPAEYHLGLEATLKSIRRCKGEPSFQNRRVVHTLRTRFGAAFEDTSYPEHLAHTHDLLRHHRP